MKRITIVNPNQSPLKTLTGPLKLKEEEKIKYKWLYEWLEDDLKPLVYPKVAGEHIKERICPKFLLCGVGCVYSVPHKTNVVQVECMVFDIEEMKEIGLVDLIDTEVDAGETQDLGLDEAFPPEDI